ncbi:penicillin-binding protein [Sphingopyxis indica]|uniref:transglycosylase domain-containing protein n=1 Tax=Sphingopyxis indica TaxID=436663 RepID=UPI002938FBE1|nr:transglycosylase domain-containing protein [Sphingopyxis indica]WOF42584.1 penicillin-binding protein [Sphingopyxis indica]
MTAFDHPLFTSPPPPAEEVPLVPPGEGASGPESRWRRRLRWAGRGFAGLALLFVVLVAWLAITAPLSKSLEPIAPPEITLLASDGTPIARTGAIVEKPVEVAKLPKHVSGAFLAIEDRRFYSHWGIDPRSIGRALWTNITSGRTEGGSTITQQLAKFTFLSPKRTLGRKAREALIAFWLEAWLSKDEILERYLSNAYFGDNAYGLRAASLHYFNRQPEKLTPAQAAMLAGLVKAPSRLAPTRNPDLAAKRMHLVLDAMAEEGYITPGQAKTLRAPRIDPRSRADLPTGTYFADWALPEARKLSDVGYARQTIRTTLDSRLQAAARRAVARAPLGKAQIALVAMRPNGEVVAMIGGKDYADSPFNRATQARRQPGSTFKLFVYLAALRAGWEPDDMIDNRPIETGGYRPKNSGGHYSPAITLERAFATSSNVAAVRLFQRVGDDRVIAMARALGVTAPLARGDSSLALGTSSMSLLELTSAYAAVAADSYPVEPRAFAAEEPGWFARIFSGPDSFSSRVHGDMEQMLRAAVNRGTGRAAMLSVPNYGKTGTSQDNRDALFVGYAGGLVVGVWIGNDDNRPLKGISGGGLPARVWRDFMTQALGQKSAPKRPAPAVDPEGPVQPLDVPDIGAIPVGEKTTVGVQDGQAVVRTEINGTPIDLRLPLGDRSAEPQPEAGPAPEPPPAPQP